jgi:pyruvate carboxylase subunit B
MELRKIYTLRYQGEDTRATLVRDGAGRVWVETEAGERIDDALVLDGGRTVSIRLGGRMYLIDVTPPQQRTRRALVNGHGGVVEFLDELAAAAREQAASAPAERELRAAMPGLVVSIKVEPGQQLRAGDPAIVLEAMKMQNELPAPGDGIVEEVFVTEGQSVDSGTLLLRLASAAPGERE